MGDQTNHHDKNTGKKPNMSAVDRRSLLRKIVMIEEKEFRIESTLIGHGSTDYAKRLLSKVSEILWVDEFGIPSNDKKKFYSLTILLLFVLEK